MGGDGTEGTRVEDWFLTRAERGNPATGIDRDRGDRAWTTGNDVTVLVDGAQYFPRLLEELQATGAGDFIYVTDLQSDGDEQLAAEGTEIGKVLADAARRGATVRALSTTRAVRWCSITGCGAAGAITRRSW